MSSRVIVFSRTHDRHSKLDPIFNGPHRVIEALAGHKMKIHDLGSGVEKTVHKDNLKKVHRKCISECDPPLTVPEHEPVSSEPPISLTPQVGYNLRPRPV